MSARYPAPWMAIATFFAAFISTYLHASIHHETDGFIAIEAEHASFRYSATVGSLHSWSDVTYSNASGDAIQCLADSGNYTLDLNGPRVDYPINFETTGVYYVWLRMAAPNTSGDSVMVAFDGASLTSNAGMGVTADGTLYWRNTGVNVDTYYGSRVTLDATSAGVHTLSLWMREDGVVVDKIILTKDSTYTPSGVDAWEHPWHQAGESLLAFDGFTDSERSTWGTTVPLNTMEWYCSSSGSLLTVASKQLVLTPGSATSRHAIAYFPRQDLEIGAAIEVSFEFKVTDPTDLSSGFRLGLFDSEGSTNYLDADADNASVTYAGYAAFTNLAPTTSNPATIRERTASASPGTALITATTDYATLGSAGGPTSGFSAGTTYRATLTIERTAASTTSITVAYEGGNLSGYSLSQTDTSSVQTQFDSVALALYAAGGIAPATDITVDNVAITYQGVEALVDDLTDGDRSNQSLATSSVAWIADDASTLSVPTDNPALEFDLDTGNTALAYFTDDGDGWQLLAGEALRADFTVRFDSTSSFPSANDFFRMALLNSSGSSSSHNETSPASPSNRLTTDGFGSGTTKFQDYAGYLASAPLAPASADNLGIYYRNYSTTTGLVDTVFAYRDMGSDDYGGTGPYGFIDDETYRGSLTVQRTGNNTSTITFAIEGTFENSGSGTWSHSANQVSSASTYVFDTIVFHCESDPDLATMTIDDIRITHLTSPSFPYIASHPSRDIVDPTETDITFSSTVTTDLDDPAVTYQWFKDGAAISGATSSSYTIAGAVNESDEGRYSVVATNPVGSSLSGAASLEVRDAVTIDTQPVSVSAYDGDSVSFVVYASGARPTTYQWKKDGTDITGAIYPRLSLDAITSADDADYTVVITNPAGSVTSSTATLSVSGGSPPIDINNSSLSASATAGSIFTYQITTSSPYTPTTYSASGLPAGLSIDTATGLIEGRPVSSGSPSVTISATNASGTDNETLSLSIASAPTPITTIAAFQDALDDAEAGDIIVLANGTYDTVGRLDCVGSDGTATNPIIIQAETPGGVTFTGEAQILIGDVYDEYAQHVIVDGFRFEDGRPQPNSNGFTSSGAVFVYGQDCRITECTIIDFNDGINQSLTVNWITIDGDRNRVDHCYFEGKRGSGPLITIRRTDPNLDFHRIDHNAFIDFQSGDSVASNGLETIRLGDSSNSLTDSWSTIEWNYFEECNGDGEVVSNKCGYNTYRYNTFINCTGQLSMRIGPGATIESNYIKQDGSVVGQGGIRASDRNHIIRYNYVEGIRTSGQGSSFIGGMGLFSSGSGDLHSSSYWPVDDVIVSHNTLVNNEVSFLYGGRSSEPNPPYTIVFDHNAARTGLNSTPNFEIVNFFKDIDDPAYTGDIYYGGTSGNIGLSPLPAGVTDAAPSLAATSVGSYTLYLASPGNEGTDTNHIFPLVAADVGPRDYTP